jgi:hypothetical protein
VEMLRGRETPEMGQQVPRVSVVGIGPAGRWRFFDAHGDGHRCEAARPVRRATCVGTFLDVGMLCHIKHGSK